MRLYRLVTLAIITSSLIHQIGALNGARLKFNVDTFYPNETYDPCQGQGQCFSSCPHQRSAPDVRLVQQEVTFDPERCLTAAGVDSSDSRQLSVGVTPGFTADAAPPPLPECKVHRQHCSVQFDYDVTGRQFALSIIFQSGVRDGIDRQMLETRGLTVTVGITEDGSDTLTLSTPRTIYTYRFTSTTPTSLLLQGQIGEDDQLQVYINGFQVTPDTATKTQPIAENPPNHPEPPTLRLGRSAQKEGNLSAICNPDISGASGQSFVGSIKQLDIFNRLLNDSEIQNEEQYATLLFNNATYPQCLCAGSDVTAGFGCATGSSRLGVPASVTDWKFMSPLGVSDGVVQDALHYGYWEAVPGAMLKLELGIVYEVTRLEIYGHPQELHVLQHYDGCYYSVFCTPGTKSSTCNKSVNWEPAERGPYKRLLWEPAILPVLTDEILVEFHSDSPPGANHVAEIEVYGRLVNHYMPDECVCFPGNGRTVSGDCDQCGRCLCRDIVTPDNFSHVDRYCSPYVTSVWPRVGPSSGGTSLTIQGGLLLPTSVNQDSTVTLRHGHVCHLNYSTNTINDTQIICTTSSVLTHDANMIPIWRHGGTNNTELKLPQKLTLNLSVGRTHVPLTTSFDFTYLPDPIMADVSPRCTFLRGGIDVTVSGDNFSADLEPMMNIIETINGVQHKHLNTQLCHVLNSTIMLCPTPTIHLDRRRRRSKALHAEELVRRKRQDVRQYLNSDRRSFTVSFDLVGITGYKKFPVVEDNLFEVYEDPVIDVWKPTVKTFKIHLNEKTIRIYGLRLRNGCTASDYTVMIGDMTEVKDHGIPFYQSTLKSLMGDRTPRRGLRTIYVMADTKCGEVTLLYDNELVCRPPPRLTQPGDVMKDGAALVRVQVGYLDVAIGYLRYEYTLWDNREFVTHVAVGVSGAILFLIIILVAMFIVKVYRQRLKMKRAKKLEFDNEILRYQGLSHDGTQDLLDLLPQDLRDELNDCLIDVKRLQLLNSIGEGNFGKVFMGILDCDNENKSEVAVKTLRDSTGGLREVIEFLQEATIMRGFTHPNVLTMHGIVLDAQQVFVVLPFMKNGDLKSHLTKKVFHCAEYLGFCCDVARGMSYLADHKFVHRDLAARNCMVDHTERALVADFGLARDIYEKDYYRIEDMTRPMPFKWMALEALRGFTFTSKSDVWSFGVLMWEIFTRGCKPYADVENRLLRQHLMQGNRLEQPQNCSDAVYNVMKQCWHAEPEQRPSFDDLVQLLEAMIKLPQGINSNPPDIGDYVDQTSPDMCHDKRTSTNSVGYCEGAEAGYCSAAGGKVVQLPELPNDKPAGIKHHVPAVPNTYSVGPQLAANESEDYLEVFDGPAVTMATKGQTDSTKGQAESADYLQPVENNVSHSLHQSAGVSPSIQHHTSNQVQPMDQDYLQPVPPPITALCAAGPGPDSTTSNGVIPSDGYQVPSASTSTEKELLHSVRL